MNYGRIWRCGRERAGRVAAGDPASGRALVREPRADRDRFGSCGDAGVGGSAYLIVPGGVAMIDPGELRYRLVPEQPVETADGAGGVTRSYATAATLWAAVTPISARGAVEADDLGADVTHRIVIRTGPEITTRHRLRDGARIFRIVAWRDQDGSGCFVDISAQERVD